MDQEVVFIFLEVPVLDKLWYQAQVIINMANAVVFPLLRLLGVQDGHGMSPFCCDFETKDDFRV